MLDLRIRGTHLIDGTGAPRRRGALGVRAGRIVLIADRIAESARLTIDAGGLCLAPGFIDIHTHADVQPFLDDPDPGRILQGATSEIAGNCGLSAAPLNERSRPVVEAAMDTLGGVRGVSFEWDTMGSFLDRMAARPLLTNIGTHVGHNTVRAAVCGLENRRAGAGELSQMMRAVATALRAGAFGFSSGLIYPPGMYAPREELTALAAVAATEAPGKQKRPYVTHIRDEGDRVLDAVEEALAIGRDSGAPVHLAHLKTTGRDNWPRQDEMLDLIRCERAAGRDVTFDQYPYTAGSTSLITLLPGWVHEGGRERLLARLRDDGARKKIAVELDASSRTRPWESVLVASVTTDANVAIEGKSLAEIARRRRCDPATALIDVCLEENGGAGMITFFMCEENVEAILREPEGGMIASDGLYGSRPHPRGYGAFARVLGRYVREREILSLEDAVSRMTARPAARLGLTDRGRLAEGCRADLVLFDPATVADNATYDEPKRPPSGVPCVFVNGVAAVEDGRLTGNRAGCVLRASGAAHGAGGGRRST